MQEDLFGEDKSPKDRETLSPDPPNQENVFDGKINNTFGTVTSRRKAKNKAYGSKAPSVNEVIKKIEENSGGLLDSISDTFKKAILHIPEDYINLDDDEIRDKLKSELQYVPTTTIEALRTNFWLEFDRCQIAREKKLNDRNIWFGACSEAVWFEVLNRHENWPKVAFIITKPPEYETNMRGLLNLATRRIRDILNISILNEKGEPRDSKTLDVVLKAAAMVDMRAKGSYVQKIEQKNLSIVKSGVVIEHKHSFGDDLSNKPIGELTHEEIQKRLDMLNAELAMQEQLRLEEKKDPPIIVQSRVLEQVQSEPPEPIDTMPVQKNKVDREIY